MKTKQLVANLLLLLGIAMIYIGGFTLKNYFYLQLLQELDFLP